MRIYWGRCELVRRRWFWHHHFHAGEPCAFRRIWLLRGRLCIEIGPNPRARYR